MLGAPTVQLSGGRVLLSLLTSDTMTPSPEYASAVCKSCLFLFARNFADETTQNLGSGHAILTSLPRQHRPDLSADRAGHSQLHLLVLVDPVDGRHVAPNRQSRAALAQSRELLLLLRGPDDDCKLTCVKAWLQRRHSPICSLLNFPVIASAYHTKTPASSFGRAEHRTAAAVPLHHTGHVSGPMVVKPLRKAQAAGAALPPQRRQFLHQKMSLL